MVVVNVSPRRMLTTVTGSGSKLTRALVGWKPKVRNVDRASGKRSSPTESDSS